MRYFLAIVILLSQTAVAEDIPIDGNYKKFLDWQLFIGSDVVARKCLHPDKELYANFTKNFKAARSQALNSMKIFMAHLNEEQARLYLDKKEIEMRRAMEKELEAKGCTSNTAKYQITTFYEQASM